MDIIGTLMEMGYFSQGSPKGFSWDARGVRIWIKGQSKDQAYRELASCVERLSPLTGSMTKVSSGPGAENTPFIVDGTLTMQLTNRQAADVWIVSSDIEGAQREAERWQDRGYRVLVVSALDQPPIGLVVDANTIPFHYSGHLPRYPAAGYMVQAWH